MSNSVAVLAEQAADLLPEAPAGHDSFGYLAWEELVLATAHRLLWSAGGELQAPSAQALTLDAHTGRLTGRALLVLAALSADPTSSASELALARAVSLRPDHACTPRRPARQRCDHADSRRQSHTCVPDDRQPLAVHLRG